MARGEQVVKASCDGQKQDASSHGAAREAGNWFPDKVGKNISQYFGLLCKEWGKTHKPREKTSKSRMAKLPAGWFLCSVCFLCLLYSCSASVLTIVIVSLNASLSQWWNIPEKTGLHQTRIVCGGSGHVERLPPG